MPTSAYDGRRWVTDRMADSNAETVIDVGPGEGTYSVLGRHLLWAAHWIAVEVFEPYIERFLLGQKYDEIIVSDIRDYKIVAENSLVLFGDVLEHMPKEDALKVLTHHQEWADEIYVSVPIVHSPQGSCFGNDHEAHLHQWTWDEMSGVMASVPGTVEAFKGVQVGRWWWKRYD